MKGKRSVPRRDLSILVVAILLLGGCVATGFDMFYGAEQEIQFPASTLATSFSSQVMGRIYVFRDNSLAGAPVPEIEVRDSGLTIGKIGAQRFLAWDRPAGETELSVTGYEQSLRKSLNVIAGKIYYLDADVTFSKLRKSEIKEIPAERAVALLKQFKAPLVALDAPSFIKASLGKARGNVADELLIKAADSRYQTPLTDTVLISAAAEGNSRLVEALISRHVDLEGRGISRRTALMAAARNGQSDICKKLIAAGASLSATDDLGNNAIDVAILGTQMDTARVLVESGAIPAAERITDDGHFISGIFQMLQADVTNRGKVARDALLLSSSTHLKTAKTGYAAWAQAKFAKAKEIAPADPRVLLTIIVDRSDRVLEILGSPDRPVNWAYSDMNTFDVNSIVRLKGAVSYEDYFREGQNPILTKNTIDSNLRIFRERAAPLTTLLAEISMVNKRIVLCDQLISRQ